LLCSNTKSWQRSAAIPGETGVRLSHLQETRGPPCVKSLKHGTGSPQFCRSSGRKSLEQGTETQDSSNQGTEVSETGQENPPEFWRNTGRNKEQRRREPPSFVETGDETRNRARNWNKPSPSNGVFIALVTWHLGHPKKKRIFFFSKNFFCEGKRRSKEIEQSYWMRAINWTHGL